MDNHELMLPKSVSKISKIIYVLTASIYLIVFLELTMYSLSK